MGYTRGTELKIDKFKKYNVAFGAMNKNKPKSLYIKISAWGNPISMDEINYKRAISKINKRLRTRLYTNTNEEQFNINKTMIDMDMRESGIEYGKSSFMSCEITLYQHNNFLLKSDSIMNELTVIVNDVIREVLEKNEYFDFYKKKIEAKKEIKKPNH